MPVPEEKSFMNIEDLDELEEIDELEEEEVIDEEEEDDDLEEEELDDEDTDEADDDEEPEEEDDEDLPASKRKIDPKVVKELTEFPELIREDIAGWPENKRRALKLHQNRLQSRVLKTEREAKQIVQERQDNEAAVTDYLKSLKDRLEKGGVDAKVAELLGHQALSIATASYYKFDEGLNRLAEDELKPIMENFYLDMGEDLAAFHKQNPLFSGGLFAAMRHIPVKSRGKFLEALKPSVQALLKRAPKGKNKRKGSRPAAGRNNRRTKDDFNSFVDDFAKLIDKKE